MRGEERGRELDSDRENERVRGKKDSEREWKKGRHWEWKKDKNVDKKREKFFTDGKYK